MLQTQCGVQDSREHCASSEAYQDNLGNTLNTSGGLSILLNCCQYFRDLAFKVNLAQYYRCLQQCHTDAEHLGGASAMEEYFATVDIHRGRQGLHCWQGSDRHVLRMK